MPDKYDVIIIGAGPAGLFTACNINRKKVLVLEKKILPGRKLMLTGSGQCNLTHSGGVDSFLNKYGENGRFLKHALYTFNNKALIRFFESTGIAFELNTEGKYFPDSRFAGDILNALLNACEQKKVEIKTNDRVLSVTKEGELFSVITENDVFTSRNLVIATGGKSYPSTGSTGDGYGISEDLGHTIVFPSEALTPLCLKPYLFADLAGMSFPLAVVSLLQGNNRVKTMQGPLLLTHKGISGPVVLHLSRYIKRNDQISINFSGFDNMEYFREAVLERIQVNPRVSIKNTLKLNGIPEAFVAKILKLIGVEQSINCAEVSKQAIGKFVEKMIDFRAEVIEKGDFDTAMVTCGGVALQEIDSKTLASKKVENLYFAGEIIDIDGDSGGYNLQACFSTAFCVAKHINTQK